MSAATTCAQAWPLLCVQPPAWHSQASVNDPRSHGSIGDRWLSLAEAILLTNGDIDENALSAEEVAQLSGFGGDIAWANIDAAIVPVITLERDLPVIVHTPHGFTVNGSNGTPTIDLGDTRGIVARSDFVDFSNLRLRGGEQGIHLTQDDTLFGTLIDRVRFEGQGVAGLRVGLLSPGRNGRVQISSCSFDGLRTAIAIDDIGDGRSGRFEVLGDTWVRDCDVGIDLALGARGSTTLDVSGLVAERCGDAVRVRSAGSPRRTLAFQVRHARLWGTRSALAIDGDPSGNTLLLAQASELASPGIAMSLGPFGSRCDVTIQDCRVTGSARILGGGTGKVLVDNAVLLGGALTLGSDGAPVAVTRSVVVATTFASLGTSPVRIRGSRLVGGSVAGTPTSPVSLEDGHHAGTTIGAHATVLRPLPAPQLGTFDVSRLEPTTGGDTTLTVDLPPGLDGWVVFGATTDFGTTLPSNVTVYADPTALVMLSAPLTGQAGLTVPIPNAPAFAGLDLYFHLAVTPRAGTVAPGLALPPGRRVRVR